MSVRPRVSVVIPVYNGQGTIARAINSVLKQDFRQSREVIVVDDGSTDGTADILHRFGRVIRVVHQENRGLSAARNAGIATAHGEFVALLDADDEWYCDKLSRQVDIMDANPALGLVSGGADCLSEEGRPLRVENPAMFGCLTDLLLYRNPINVSSVMLRARILNSMTRWFREELPVCEDWDMWLRLSVTCAFHIDSNVVVAHYETRDGMSRKDPQRLLSVYTSTYQLLFDTLRNEPVLGTIVKREWSRIQTNVSLILALQQTRLDPYAAGRKTLRCIISSPISVRWRTVLKIMASLGRGTLRIA